jgi:HSP20 family molecular chaperone IbpA
MYQFKKQKDRFSRQFNNIHEDDINNGVPNRMRYGRIKSKDVQIKETDSGFHYELKIPGYIREDFRFYISNNDLVVTTEKGKTEKGKHAYCYPSAYFKKRFPLPHNVNRNEIKVDYMNEVLCFDLYKLNQ